MNIRLERPEDFEILYHFVREAFATAAMADGDEQDFVNRLRAGENYLPELALVAEDESGIVGHIMLTRTALARDGHALPVRALLLAPLAVRLDRRGQGVGSALAREALRRAQERGYTAVFLAGDRNYYSRFGFVPASRYGIACTMQVPAELLDNIMACELASGALDGLQGSVANFAGH